MDDYNEILKDINEEVTSLGYFEHDYSYISLTQNKVIWMSLSPYEIETMKEDILNAKGNVLTYGLGIGYFAYMCSLKDEVETVTIVEKDKNIISNNNASTFYVRIRKRNSFYC